MWEALSQLSWVHAPRGTGSSCETIGLPKQPSRNPIITGQVGTMAQNKVKLRNNWVVLIQPANPQQYTLMSAQNLNYQLTRTHLTLPLPQAHVVSPPAHASK